MGKTITIEVPDWVGREEVEEIKKTLAEILARQMKGSVDPSVYRAYLALAFPDTGFTELEDEEKLLEDMRKREKERLK